MLIRFAVLPVVAASLCFGASGNWDARAAAGYLDSRAQWWMGWSNAARDHDTFCVSCHTAVPYALSRPKLRQQLQESAESQPEQKLIANVRNRVRLWGEVKPFYLSSEKAPNRSVQSRSTEAVLNALILVNQASGQKGTTPELALALENFWAAQITEEGPERGAFPWLDFHNRPWEADDSQFYGTALAAITVGMMPAEVRQSKQHAIDSLAEYLRGNYQSQSLVNQTVALWASAKLPAVLPESEKAKLLRHLAEAQREDGGWSLTALAGPWKRNDGTSLETASDGYATGLVAYAMINAGVPRTDSSLTSGLRWLAQNQSATDGRWPGYSLNKNRALNSDAGRFMSDAATAYAVLALTAAK